MLRRKFVLLLPRGFLVLFNLTSAAAPTLFYSISLLVTLTTLVIQSLTMRVKMLLPTIWKMSWLRMHQPPLLCIKILHLFLCLLQNLLRLSQLLQSFSVSYLTMRICQHLLPHFHHRRLLYFLHHHSHRLLSLFVHLLLVPLTCLLLHSLLASFYNNFVVTRSVAMLSIQTSKIALSRVSLTSSAW